jgi:carboxymethylenebutenolidase
MYGKAIELQAEDGHQFAAYVSPAKSALGAIVLLQEIFGITDHIREVSDSYANLGYTVIAPALFDRVERGVVLGYSNEDAAKGRDLRSRIAPEKTLADVRAARDHVAAFGRVATLGYCWGGTVAWVSAARVDGLSASVCYYPTQLGPFIAERPQIPVLMHFGEQDPIAPLKDAQAICAAHGDGPTIYTYPAGHGFNCDQIPAFDRSSAELAMARTLAFLRSHLVDGSLA